MPYNPEATNIPQSGARVYAAQAGVQPESVFLGYVTQDGLNDPALKAREDAVAAAAEAEAREEIEEDEAPGETIATQILADDELDAMIETMTVEQFRRTAIVVFASDVSACIERTNDIPANIPDILTIARYIETGE